MKKSDLMILALIIIAVYFLSRNLGKGPNDKHLKQLDPAVRNQFRSFLNDIKQLGYTPVIISSGRTYEQQAYFKKQDARNASPGHSSHEMGNAIDIRLLKNGKVLTKSTPKIEWQLSGVPTLAKNKYKMRWGGDFHGYPDNNHFDYLT